MCNRIIGVERSALLVFARMAGEALKPRKFGPGVHSDSSEGLRRGSNPKLHQILALNQTHAIQVITRCQCARSGSLATRPPTSLHHLLQTLYRRFVETHTVYLLVLVYPHYRHTP